MRGTLHYEDLGAGGWTLKTSDGKSYALEGDIPSSLKGKQVEVSGTVQESGGFGFMMSGDPVLVVDAIKAV